MSDTPKEANIEAYLVRKVRDLGGKCMKFLSPGSAGMPDRLIVLPGGVIAFMELKRLGEVPSDLQAKRISDLHKLGANAYWASNKAQVDSAMRELEFERDLFLSVP